MRRLVTTLVVLLAAAVGAPASAAPADPPRERTLYEDGHGERWLLGGTWLFRADPQDQGLSLRFQDQSTTDGWSERRIPDAFNAGDDSPESQRGSVVWYRRDFRLPRGEDPESWKVRFESVNYRAKVWLNGRELGDHEGAYVPFELELPNAVLSDRRVNRLVVRVDSRRSDTDVPPMRESQVTGLPGGGWWNYGGLLREVYLRHYDRVDLEELMVRPLLRCRSCDATVLVQGTLRNDPGGRRKVRLQGTVGGRRFRSRPVTIPSNRARTVTARVRIRDPRLWELDDPDLYEVHAEVRRGRRALSSYDAHVGIRSVEVDRRGRLRLNGRRIRIRGASIHEDDPAVGAALSPGKRRRIFAQLLALNANVTRAHYPLHPQFYELADRSGVLIWDQVPFYRLKEDFVQLRSVRNKGLRYIDAMIRRDRNHPSVLAWSIANELSRNIGPGQERYIRDALRRIERLDPTRLTAIDIAGYPSVRLRSIYRQLDALGVNSYFGWYPGPIGSVLNREVLGPYLDQLHEYYRSQALVVTEFGAEANRVGPVGEKGTFAFQDDFMRYHVRTYDRRPYVVGAIAWILQDFKVRPGWDGYNRKPSPPYNKKGLVDESFNRKPAFDATARLFGRVTGK